MKNLSLISLFLALFIASCGSPAPPLPSASATEVRTRQTAPAESSPSPASFDPIESEVVKQLALHLALDPSSISVISNEASDFPDSCLGVALPDVMCAEVITPGRTIVLQANAIQYEYHVSQDGSRVQPATYVLTWRREGGIAGLCDSLVIFRSGEIYGNRCAAVTDGRMSSVSQLLASAEQAQFQSWLQQFGRLSMDASDPKAVADRMTITLVFQGLGSQEASVREEKQMLELAATLHQRLFSEDSLK
jgi:hypothetical protein